MPKSISFERCGFCAWIWGKHPCWLFNHVENGIQFLKEISRAPSPHIGRRDESLNEIRKTICQDHEQGTAAHYTEHVERALEEEKLRMEKLQDSSCASSGSPDRGELPATARYAL